MKDIYELYERCFPENPVKYEVFCEVLHPEKAHIISRRASGRLIGFAMVHGSSLTLLCVREDYRNRGVGSAILKEAEEYIGKSYSKIILGRGPCYLLQGVPESEENIGFFLKRGYSASWSSVNMSLELEGFDEAALKIPQTPEPVLLRMLKKGEEKLLLEAVEDAHPAWRAVYGECKDPVFVAESEGRIVGFQILSPEGGRFCRAGEKTGSIGCVGVVRDRRRQGIGLRMVAAGADWLKKQGCNRVELRYVELTDWYSKIGFSPVQTQWMGEKILDR